MNTIRAGVTGVFVLAYEVEMFEAI